jgi:hypothetical protein
VLRSRERLVIVGSVVLGGGTPMLETVLAAPPRLLARYAAAGSAA